MTNHVLVPTDGSPLSEQALTFTFEEYGDAEITVIHVIDPVEVSYGADPANLGYWDAWYEAKQEEGERIVEEAREAAEAHGCSVETVVEVGRPGRVITEYAEEHGVDHIVMGSHGRKGISRVLMGSVAEVVMRRATMPVTVVR